MSEPVLRYAGAHLRRDDTVEYDAETVGASRRDPSSRVVPLWRDGVLTSDAAGRGIEAVCYRIDAAERLLGLGDTPVLLGYERTGEAVFAIDLSAHSAEEVAPVVDPAGFRDLRQVGPALPARDAHILAYARALLHWHRQHAYCGRCGARTVSRRGGHLRCCTAAACGREHYPRTDPAIIVLVVHEGGAGEPPRCLLAQHARLPPRVFTTLAGFVEPGESLEETVAREVYEEVGLLVTGVTYQASQPWPFPSQIMLGFRARAVDLDIRVDGREIAAAHWFTAEELCAAGDWGDQSAPMQLPRRDSIARYLVDDWAGAQRRD